MDEKKDPVIKEPVVTEPALVINNKSTEKDNESAQVVKQAIKDDQGLAPVAKDIHVTVKNGAVTLEGHVATDQQSNLATNTASALGIDGKVKNHLDVTHNNQEGK